MFYTIYKITNKLNGKFYIGKHQTLDLDDGYFGSGIMIRRAIKKHGKDNFTKEIIHVFDNEEEMNAKEAEIVIISEDTYNLCHGGKGGWSYVNDHGFSVPQLGAKKTNSIHKDKLPGWGSLGGIATIKKHGISAAFLAAGPTAFLGKTHSEETKRTIGKKNSIRQQGNNNSQYGTCWITNGKDNKKIKKEELDFWVKSGYYKGRK